MDWSSLASNQQWEYAGRLAAACLAGGIIGLERELHDKPAGFRTNILICLGAALFTVVSETMARNGGSTTSDVTRIAAQVVTGVGFLGAGAIMQARGTVIGLTTAATIWTVASAGMAFGAGQYFLGSAVTVLAVITLLMLTPMEDAIAAWQTKIHLEVKTPFSDEAINHMEALLKRERKRCRGWSVTKSSEGYSFHITLVGPERDLGRIQRELMALPVVRAVERI